MCVRTDEGFKESSNERDWSLYLSYLDGTGAKDSRGDASVIEEILVRFQILDTKTA